MTTTAQPPKAPAAILTAAQLAALTAAEGAFDALLAAFAPPPAAWPAWAAVLVLAAKAVAKEIAGKT